MDAPAADPEALRRALGFIRRINTALGYNAATGKAIEAIGGGSVLDVACGSADLAEHLAGHRYIGLDLHQTTLGIAQEWQPGAALVRGDALRLPFGDGSMDLAVCQMALHHFETRSAERIVAEMERVSRRGWVVADLLRRRRALGWITLFTLFADPMVRHDARTSVRQAWSPEEARGLGAPYGATFSETFGHRFLLVRRKPSAQTRFQNLKSQVPMKSQ